MNPKISWNQSIFIFDNIRFIAIFTICFCHATWDKLLLISDTFAYRLSDAASTSACVYAIPLFAFVSGYGQKIATNTDFFKKIFCLYLGANIINLPFYFYYASKTGENYWLSHIVVGPAGVPAIYLWANSNC